MKKISWSAALVAGLLPAAQVLAAGSLLRIACEGADVGAEITVNGAFKGECPLDIQVNSGTIELRVVKKVDAERERVFQQQFRMGDGVVKKVEAVLSLQLNADGLRREREREAARQAAATEARRADQELLEQQTGAAEAGDAAAMLALAERHETGRGLPKSDALAAAWYGKAAAAGNEVAKFILSALYKQRRNDPDVKAVLSMLALPVESRRDVVVEGGDAIRAFVSTDPFFIPTGGGQKISYSYAKPVGTMRFHDALTCERKGNVFAMTSRTQVNDASSATEGEAVLGGIVWLLAKASHGFMRSTTTELTRLEKPEGQPFPLTPGKRFGFTFTYVSSGTYAGKLTNKLTCAATDVKVEAVGNVRIPDGAQQVVCYTENGILDEITRYYLHEGSGCLVNVGRR